MLRAYDSGFRVSGLRLMIQGLGFTVQGLGYGARDSGLEFKFRFWALGMRGRGVEG